jgi:hypothetical protein
MQTQSDGRYTNESMETMDTNIRGIFIGRGRRMEKTL